MCGRYTLSTPADLLGDLFELEEVPQLLPRFNIAPTQEAPVLRVLSSGAKRQLELLRWGLVPFWAKDPAIGNRMINARAESVGEKPAFRNSFKRRRCLVLADGFYEWKATGGRKQPYFFGLEGGEPFGFAGLWDRWEKGDEGPLESFTIITTEPNEIVAPVHRRMPVILELGDYATWLDPEIEEPEQLVGLLKPFSGSRLSSYAVSTYVNNPANEGPQCVVEVDETS